MATNKTLNELREAFRDAPQRRRRAVWEGMTDLERTVVDCGLEWIGNPFELLPVLKGYGIQIDRRRVMEIVQDATAALKAAEVAA